MSELLIRTAARGDAPAIARIYNHYVETSTATFDTQIKTISDREAWLEDHDERHPVLVAEADGVVVGWGSLTRWAARPAWSRTVEVAVYLDATATGRGVGPALLEQLVEAGRRAGHHALLAQIVAGNDPSIKMSLRAGFERVGTLREVGWKFDRWLDVALLELVLD